jgi:hypothetical protein
MDKLMRPLKNKYPGMVQVYMDDILISTPSDLELHQRIVHDVLDALEAASFFLQVAKCVFEVTKIEYLGLLINGETLRIDPTKLKGIQDWPTELKSLKEVRSFLGVAGYHRPWIRDFSGNLRNCATPYSSIKKGYTFRLG